MVNLRIGLKGWRKKEGENHKLTLIRKKIALLDLKNKNKKIDFSLFPFFWWLNFGNEERIYLVIEEHDISSPTRTKTK